MRCLFHTWLGFSQPRNQIRTFHSFLPTCCKKSPFCDFVFWKELFFHQHPDIWKSTATRQSWIWFSSSIRAVQSGREVSAWCWTLFKMLLAPFRSGPIMSRWPWPCTRRSSLICGNWTVMKKRSRLWAPSDRLITSGVTPWQATPYFRLPAGCLGPKWADVVASARLLWSWPTANQATTSSRLRLCYVISRWCWLSASGTPTGLNSKR